MVEVREYESNAPSFEQLIYSQYDLQIRIPIPAEMSLREAMVAFAPYRDELSFFISAHLAKHYVSLQDYTSKGRRGNFYVFHVNYRGKFSIKTLIEEIVSSW